MNRDVFLGIKAKKIVEVEIPGYGTVKMRELTESQRVNGFDLWLRPNGSTIIDRNQKDARLKIVSLCVVGDDGQPFLTDADFGEMRDMPAGVISKLAEVAMSLAGLSDDDIEGKLKKKSDNSSETIDDTCT